MGDYVVRLASPFEPHWVGRRLIPALTLIVAVHGAAAAAPPQQIASRQILAAVTDARGQPIADIDPDDFVIREADQVRDVLSIRVADYPIVVVIDNGPGANRDFEAIRQASSRFISRAGRRPIAVASTSPPRVIATFADDRSTLLERVNKLRKGRSPDGLLPAVAAAAQDGRETGAPFVAVVLVAASPGGDAAPDILPAILESGANVHVVVQQRAWSPSARRPRPSVDTLTALVDGARGWLTSVTSADAFQPALDGLANKLASEWIVEYVVPADSAARSDVRLGVRIAEAKVTNWGVSRR